MALRYRIPLLGLPYYSGRVGPRRWLPRSSNTGTGPMGFVVKWFVVYPSVAIFGAGLAILLVPFYVLLWVVRRLLRNRQGCRLVVQRFPVQWPLLQRPVLGPALRPYGFVPAPQPVRPVSYGFVPAQRKRLAFEGGPFGSDQYV